jgi:phage/conjugal plasmid C-4 type zinc finger TraR family protein
MDLCQQINQELIDDALENHRRRMPAGFSLTHCCVCCKGIPEARRLALPGVVKCYDCQLEWETMHGRGK